MALSSTSTLEDALAQYNNNLNWEGDLTAARAALAAVRWILVNRPKIIATNDRNISFEALSLEKERIESFIGSSDTSINRCSFVRGKAM